MLQKQQSYFVVREKTGSHDNPVLAFVDNNKHLEKLRKLMREVFSHNYLLIHDMKSEDISNISPELIKKFHEKYYCKVTIHNGIDEKCPVVDNDKFLEEITEEPKNENGINFLVGPVGSGKTTLISNIIITKFERIHELNIWPVRFDVDIAIARRGLKKYRMLYELYRCLRNSAESLNLISMEQLQKWDGNNDLNSETRNQNQIESAIEGFVHLVREKSNKRLLLVFDNVDYIFHKYDRGLFSTDMKSSRQKAYRYLLNIISDMIRGSTSKLSHMNVNVLIVMRSDSIEHLEHLRKLVNPNVSFANRYTISPAAINDVLNKRIEFIEKLINEEEDEQAKLFMLNGIKNISSDNGKINEKLFNNLTSICRGGMRDSIEHLGKYGALRAYNRNRNNELSERLFNQYAPMLLTYTLGGLRQYSQFSSNFPNIYLVDSQAFVDNLTPRLRAPHKHTYWLKRLILEAIFHMRVAKQSVRSIVIKSIFSGNNRYEESIVELALSSLSHGEYSGLIQAQFDYYNEGYSLVPDSIYLTPRGKYFYEKFMHSFVYLQLLVDDHLLAIPRCVIDDFMYEDLDYSYLVKNERDYKYHTMKMIALKANMVSIFLNILEISLEIEKEIFHDVFVDFEQHGVIISPIEKTRKRIGNELFSINQYLGTSITLKNLGVENMNILKSNLQNSYYEGI